MSSAGIDGMGARVAVVLPTLSLYVQEVISAKFKDAEAQVLAEVERQFNQIDMNELIRETVDRKLKSTLQQTLTDCINTAIYSNESKALRQTLTESLSRYLGKVGAQQEYTKCEHCGKY